MIVFITGIDTNIGKTYITGLIARYLYKNKKSVITQKLVQTGLDDGLSDIYIHRKIMEKSFTEEDKSGITTPYKLKFPASPHLSARLENIEIDTKFIENQTEKLEHKYEYVLIEGAGGLIVPLIENYTTLDYINENHYPVILVTSSRLGSINHTLLSIEALKNRNIKILGVVYVVFEKDPSIIAEDSYNVIKSFSDNIPIIKVSEFNLEDIKDYDFSVFFKF